MPLVKAIPLGLILTFVVALVIGSQGSSGGVLVIQNYDLGDYNLLWSWPMFFASTGLSWGLLLMMK